MAPDDGVDKRISRRATLKRLGVAAGVAWSAPVITSVSIRAAAAGSPPPSTEPTSTTTTETTAPQTSTTTAQAQRCVRTQGYWKNHASGHYDATWDAIGGPDAPFFDTGKGYLEILTTPPAGGNAFLILAHQWIAAELNVAAGASAPPQVQAAFQDAKGLLQAWSTSGNIPKQHADRARAVELATTLDQYNNGNAGTPRCH
jgi:hypothetical protein